MNTRAAILGLLFLSTLAAWGAASVREQLQKGIYEQEINNNLQSASASFESVLSELEPERIIAANALSRLGEIQQMLGKTNEAHASRLRLLRDFSDQTNLVATALRADPTIKPTVISSQEQSPEPSELKVKAQSIVNQLKAESGTKRRSFAAQVGSAEIKQSMQTIEKLQLEVTSLQDLGPNHPEMQKAQAKLKQAESQMDNRIEAMIQVLEKDPSLILLVTSNKDTETEEDLELKRIKQLIKESPDLINGRLSKACELGQLKVVTLLLENGADPNHISDHNTPLQKAVMAGRRTIVECLVNHGADVNKKTPETFGGASFGTALQQAAYLGYASIVQFLVEKGAELNPGAGGAGQGTPLLLAMKQKHLAIVRFLLSAGADVNMRNFDDQSALSVALRLGWLEGSTLVLSNKAELNVIYKWPRTASLVTPLGFAASSGNAELVRLTLKAGANPNGVTNAEPPLNQALNNSEIATLLVKSGANPDAFAPVFNSWHRRLLDNAVESKLTNVVSLLLDLNANPNLLDGNGFAPVHYASWEITAQSAPRFFDNVDKRIAILELLSRKGANLNLAATNGMTALKGALGWHPSTPPQRGSNPFNMIGNEFKIAEWLANHHANLNAKFDKGDTLLHWAVQHGDIDCVRFLLDKGADPNLKNEEGKTPLDIRAGKLAGSPQNYHGSTPDHDFSAEAVTIVELLEAKGCRLSASTAHLSGMGGNKSISWPLGTEMSLGNFLRSASTRYKYVAGNIIRRGSPIRIEFSLSIAEAGVEKVSGISVREWDEIEITSGG